MYPDTGCPHIEVSCQRGVLIECPDRGVLVQRCPDRDILVERCPVEVS